MSDPDASDATAPTLVVTGGPFDGRTLTLEFSAKSVLGSGMHSSLRLQAGNVDTEHAGLTWDADGVRIRDLGSRSGTYVNGEKLDAERLLQDGDRVFLGPPISPDSVRLVVHVPPAAATADPMLFEAQSEPMLLEAESEPLDLAQGESSGDVAEPGLEPEPEPLVEAEPEPRVEPEPPLEPEPEPAVAAAAPAPVAKAGAPAATQAPPSAGKPVAPQYYSDDAPSIGGDRVRAPLEVPAAEAPPKAAPAKGRGAKVPRARLGLAAVPRPVLVAAATLLAAGLGGYAACRLLHAEPPVMAAILPPKAEAAQTVTISGSGFATTPAGNVVRFGDQPGSVTSASESQLAVTVPSVKVAAGAVDLQVSVEARGVRSNALFFKLTAPPRITALEPDVAMPGDELVATGQNLVGQGMTVSVGHKPAELIEVAPTAVRVRVPPLDAIQGQAVPVVAQVGSESSKPASLLIGRLPLLLDATPRRGLAGSRVTLKGRGFGPNPQDNAVAFGGAQAVVLAASPHELVVAAPGVRATETQSALAIHVVAQGQASTQPLVFTLERPPSASYVPRFFPSPLDDHPGHDHVLVSSEIGPVLLLTGKADAPSTAERAERAADALNRLFQMAGAGQTVTFERRDGPAVGAAGEAHPVAVVTPADAAAYSESWDGQPARRAGTQTVADYWTALLQDQLTLFARRQRPARLLELTPRGRVLTELFAEAQRTAGAGAGVPFELAARLPPGTLQALRDVALQLPAEGGPARAAAAIEGRWTGTLVEGDAGERQVEVVFRLQGGVLSGSLTSRAGGIAMNVPMREARYERGSVRFVVVVRGAPRHFVGTLVGETITGTIHDSAAARESVGRFTLNYAQ